MTSAPAPETALPQPKPFLLRFYFSVAWGTLAIALGAAAWGAIAYFANSVHVTVAVLIGLAVSYAIVMPLQPIHKAVALLFLPVAAAAALLAILLGEMLYIVLVLMRDNQYTFLKAFTATAEGIGEILQMKGTLTSGVLGLIGAAVGFFAAWKDL